MDRTQLIGTSFKKTYLNKNIKYLKKNSFTKITSIVTMLQADHLLICKKCPYAMIIKTHGQKNLHASVSVPGGRNDYEDRPYRSMSSPYLRIYVCMEIRELKSGT